MELIGDNNLIQIKLNQIKWVRKNLSAGQKQTQPTYGTKARISRVLYANWDFCVALRG